MVNKSIVDYITKAKEQNISDDMIRNNLVTAGWHESDVNDSFLSLNPNMPEVPSPTLAVPTPIVDFKSRIEMWDAFEHFIMFICLLISSSAISYILHYYISDVFPENTINNLYYSANTWALTLLRFSTASLIVSGPIYAYLFLRVQKKTENCPEIQNMYLRRTLIYLTLIVTFMIIVVNVINLIYSFLDGKVNSSFILHFFAWIIVYGSIFAYYVTQVKIGIKKA